MLEPWAWLASFALALAVGGGSAVVPFTSTEAYVVAAQATGLGVITATWLGAGLGAGLGKVLVFWALRNHRRLPWLRRWQPGPPRTGWIGRLQRVNRRALRLVGDPRWGGPMLALGSVFGIPPLYPMVVLAATSPMRLPVFALITVGGRMLRFALIGYGVVAVLPG